LVAAARPPTRHPTLPGIAVPTELRPRRNTPPAPLVAPAIAPPIVPVGWQTTLQVQTWIPEPVIAFEPPTEQLASGSGPQLPTRSHGALWIALAIVCGAAIAIAALL
jgi:hypothetical protein